MIRSILPVLFLLGFLFPALSWSGPTLSVGGRVLDAADATTAEGGNWRVFLASNSIPTAEENIDNTGYWYGEAGYFLSELSINDELMVLIEKETGTGENKKGYFGIAATTIDGADPVEFSDITLYPLPVPTTEINNGIVVSWSTAPEYAPGGNIAGYNLYGSPDGLTFSKLNIELITTTSFTHQDPADTFYYALSIAINTSPQVTTTVLSEKSVRPFLTGDLNDDLSLDLADVIVGLQVLSSMAVSVSNSASVNTSTPVGLDDVIYILREIGGNN